MALATCADCGNQISGPAPFQWTRSTSLSGLSSSLLPGGFTAVQSARSKSGQKLWMLPR